MSLNSKFKDLLNKTEYTDLLRRILKNLFTTQIEIDNENGYYDLFLEYLEKKGVLKGLNFFSLKKKKDKVSFCREGNNLLLTRLLGEYVIISTTHQKKEYVDYNKITVYFFGNKQEKINYILDILSSQEKLSHTECWKVFACRYSCWEEVRRYPRTNEDLAIVSANVKKNFEKDIETWINNKNWYTQRGIAYRRGYLLHGPPGTGKTTLARHVANKFGLDLYTLAGKNIDKDLQSHVRKIPNNSILLIEDIDNVFNKRKAKNEQVAGFGDFLNALDGVVTLNHIIFIITTNDINVMDEALIRPGRIDKIIYVGQADEDQLKQVFLKFFPEASGLAEEFAKTQVNKNLTLAEVQAKLLTICAPEQYVEVF